MSCFDFLHFNLNLLPKITDLTSQRKTEADHFTECFTKGNKAHCICHCYAKQQPPSDTPMSVGKNTLPPTPKGEFPREWIEF